MYGPMGEHNSDGIHVNFVRSNHEEMLSMQLERMYNTKFRDALVENRIKASKTEKLEIWKHGPHFLRKDSDECPQQPTDLYEELSDHDE